MFLENALLFGHGKLADSGEGVGLTIKIDADFPTYNSSPASTPQPQRRLCDQSLDKNSVGGCPFAIGMDPCGRR